MSAVTATIEQVGIFHFPLDMTASLSWITDMTDPGSWCGVSGAVREGVALRAMASP